MRCASTTRIRTRRRRWLGVASRSRGSPAEVASAAEIVLMSLPTPDIVKAVALGGKRCVARGNRVRTLIDLSTTGPGVASIVAQGLATRDMTLVDAPVSGGVSGAKAGTLAVMVSCPKDGYGRVEPILKNFGKVVLHRRQTRPGADREAGQQPVGGGGAGDHLGRHGNGGQGRSRPENPARYHQRLFRPQQRHPGQNSRARCCQAASISALPPRFPTRMSDCASTRRGSDGRADDHGRGGAPDPGLDPGQVWAGFRFHLDRRLSEEWAGVQIRG